MEKLQTLQDLSEPQKKGLPLFIIMLVYIGITPLFDAGFDHDFMYWLVLLTIPVLLILNFRDKPVIRVKWADPGFYLVLFVLWAGLSFIWSIHQLRTVIEWVQLVSYTIAYFAMRKLDDEFKEKVLRIGSITAVILAVYGIIQFVLIVSQRVQATFTNPNPFGTYLAMFFLFLWAQHLREESRARFISSAILLTAVVLSGSKGTYLAIFVASFLVYIGMPKSNMKAIFLQTAKLVVVTTLSVALIFFLTPLIQEKVRFGTNFLESLVRMNSFNTSSSARVQFWKVAWELILNRPLTGYGYGSYFASHFIEYRVGDIYSRFAHNHYLQLAAELGLPGLLLFGSFCLMILKHTYVQIKRQPENPMVYGAIAAFSVFLFHVVIEFSWNFPAVPIVFFAMAGVISVENKQVETAENEKRRLVTNQLTTVLLILTFFLVASLTVSIQFNEKGLNAANEGDYDQAIQDFERSFQIAPYSSPNRYIMAEIYFKKYQESHSQEDLDRAIDFASQSVDLVPYGGKDHHFLANLYFTDKQLELAKQQYQLAIRYNAYELSAFIDFSTFYLSQKLENEALAVLLDGSTRIEQALYSVLEPQERFAAFQRAIYIHSTIAKLYANRGEEVLADDFKKSETELIARFEQAKMDYEKTLKEQA